MQTSMPRVEFEPMIPVFERAKIFHALDRSVTVIGNSSSSGWLLSHSYIACFHGTQGFIAVFTKIPH
jgi:hypothetical protein